MKIIFFNDEKYVTETLENVDNPMFYGINEVRWNEGGASFFTDNYLILEDDVKFEDVTDEEFLRQYKEQAKFELAKVLERDRVSYMVNGTLAEKEQQFVEDKARIDSLLTIEEVILFLNEWKIR
jgi:hypothetical protein